MKQHGAVRELAGQAAIPMLHVLVSNWQCS